MGSRRRGDRRRTWRTDDVARILGDDCLSRSASAATRRTALLSDVLVGEITTGGVADHEYHQPPTDDDDLRDFSMKEASSSSSDTRLDVSTTTRPHPCHMTHAELIVCRHRSGFVLKLS